MLEALIFSELPWAKATRSNYKTEQIALHRVWEHLNVSRILTRQHERLRGFKNVKNYPSDICRSKWRNGSKMKLQWAEKHFARRQFHERRKAVVNNGIWEEPKLKVEKRRSSRRLKLVMVESLFQLYVAVLSDSYSRSWNFHFNKSNVFGRHGIIVCLFGTV